MITTFKALPVGARFRTFTVMGRPTAGPDMPLRKLDRSRAAGCHARPDLTSRFYIIKPNDMVIREELLGAIGGAYAVLFDKVEAIAEAAKDGRVPPRSRRSCRLYNNALSMLHGWLGDPSELAQIPLEDNDG